jgi:hypothetical protein
MEAPSIEVGVAAEVQVQSRYVVGGTVVACVDVWLYAQLEPNKPDEYLRRRRDRNN